jgi:hypothetical protein
VQLGRPLERLREEIQPRHDRDHDHRHDHVR